MLSLAMLPRARVTISRVRRRLVSPACARLRALIVRFLSYNAVTLVIEMMPHVSHWLRQQKPHKGHDYRDAIR